MGSQGPWLERYVGSDGNDAGHLLHVPGDRSVSRPNWRVEFASRRQFLALRIRSGADPVAWVHLDDWWSYIEMLLTDRVTAPVIGPLRAQDLRALGTTPSDHRWSEFFLRQLQQSASSPLHPGQWLLTFWREERRQSLRELGLHAPVIESGQPSRVAFTDYQFGNRVLHLRPPSSESDSRVRVWRKYCRDGALPPVLLLYQSALLAYLVIDGHDRLQAAQLEGVEPPLLILAPLARARALPDTDATRHRREVLERLLLEAKEPARVDGLNRALLSLHSRATDFFARSRVWPLAGGIAAWRAEIAERALRSLDPEVRKLADQMRYDAG